MAKYIYPALFTKESNGYSIDFPDIPGCYTCGNDLDDGMNMAADALSLMLTHLEDEGRDIPPASDIASFKSDSKTFATYISCDTTLYRRLLNNQSVKKTLSIPSWLNDSAIAAGINFSQTLQEALINKLHLTPVTK